jgi:hypothetical protein
MKAKICEKHPDLDVPGKRKNVQVFNVFFCCGRYLVRMRRSSYFNIDFHV